MRSKNSMYNLLAAVMLQLVNLIVGMILPRIMLVSFGSEVNGLTSSIKQFIGYLNLVEAGLAGACVYSLYKPLAEKNYDKINQILSGAKQFYNRSGVLFSILALMLSIIFPYIANSETIGNATITILVLILGLNGSLEFFSMGKYRALLTADQKSYVISTIQAVGQVLNCLIIVILALNQFNIIIVQAVATSSYIIRTILFNKYVHYKYQYVNFNVESNSGDLHQRWDVLFHQVSSMIIFNSPVALITFFCSLIEVSIYSIYNIVFAGINGIVSIFNSGLMAGIGDIISRGNLNHLQKVYREYEYGYYMIVTWMYSCAYILIMPFISVYTKGIGDANYIRSELAIMFMVIGILNSLRIPQVTVVGAAGHYKQTRYRTLIEVIINVIMSLIMVQKFGMIGVLIGGMCSYIYRTLDLIIYVPMHITQLSVMETVSRIARMMILGIIIIIPFKTIIDIQVENIIQWSIWGIGVTVWSGIVVFIGNYIGDKQQMENLIGRILCLLRPNV